MTRPRLRWIALLVAVPALLLALTAWPPGPSHHAPPGADGELAAEAAGAAAVIDHRPDRRPRPRADRPDDRVDGGLVNGHVEINDDLLRLEAQVKAGSPPGSVVDVDTGFTFDPGPDEEFIPVMVTGEGYEVVGGGARAGRGERVAYTVEVDPRVHVDPLAVTAAVERALHDPRSWAADVELVRVEDPADARIRVVLARPDEVDRLCAEAGLNTAGRFSCWNGTIAALNAMRWDRGAADFDDLDSYRTYLVNHEFGHGLGHGHVDCPGPGRLAPVMMQQTRSTDVCAANGWPYPERSAD